MTGISYNPSKGPETFTENDTIVSMDIVRYLLDLGYSSKVTNVSGVSPLHLGAWYGLEDIVDLVIAHGCDIDGLADDGYKMRWAMAKDSEAKTLFNRETDLYRPDTFCVGCDITSLYLAARGGHVKVLKKLISVGANVNATKSYGQHQGITPLHAAAARGNEECVQALLDAGSDINHRASDGGTALHCGCEFGHPQVVKALLEHKVNGKRTIDIMAKKRAVEAEDITALHLAATVAAEEVVKLLVDADIDINSQASDGFTAIHLAAQNGAVPVAKVLLEAGCNLNKVACLDGCEGLTPFHLAVRVGNEEHIDELVKYGAEIHTTAAVSDVAGVSSLHLASVCGHHRIVRKLIRLGADVNARTSTGSTSLFLAVKEGNDDVVRFLLEANCDVTVQQSEASPGIVHLAIMANNERVLRMLIRAGCSINEPAKSEENGDITPLYIAVDNKHIQMVKLLLELGADPDQELKDGFTVLHTSAEQGLLDIVKVLIDHGCAADKTAKFGDLSLVTPLHLAVMNKFPEVVKILAKAGANLNASKLYNGKGGFTLCIYL